MSGDTTIWRFVLQRHWHPDGNHWDLMLEQDDALATWRLTELLSADNPTVPAQRIFDHRKAYLDYQGTISQGRGQVCIEDSGTYHRREVGPERWVVRLDGQVLNGWFVLDRQQERDWTLHRTGESV